MYAIKRELKVNNTEANWLAQCAGFSRFVYNYGLGIMKASWEEDHLKANDSKRLNAIKKVFTNVTKKSTEFAWCNKYPSRIYQNAFRNLAKALSRWRDPLLKAHMPKFKKKRHQCSFTVDDCNGKRLLFAGKKINIPTLGWFSIIGGDPLQLYFPNIHNCKSCREVVCILQNRCLSRSWDQTHPAESRNRPRSQVLCHIV